MHYIIIGYFLPILIGFLIGFFLSFPLVITVSILTSAYAAFLFIRTHDQEIGALIGLMAVFSTIFFNGSLWIAYFFSSGGNLNWIFR